MAPRSSFLAIGHVARDEFPDGAHRLGGTALYAAATAARLGVPTALVTRVGPNEKDELGRTCADLGVDLRALDANVTTTFAFRWDDAGRRILRLKARAKGISHMDVPEDLRSVDPPGGIPDALVFGSIARELSRDLLAGETARISVLAAQGMLRTWDADGTVRPAAWDGAEAIVGTLSCTVLSEDDVAGETAVVERWSTAGPVVLTLAERGCRVYERGHPTAELPAYPPARLVDTTGAGDTFAAGLAIALGEGRSLADACRFANAVASFGLEGPGISALADRQAVERRLGG
jgi:sugar/nucleoside kinase (ribokinase family)